MDKYDGSQIVILEGLEAVRKRPGMYIGSTGTRGLHHLIWEILDNGIDEHLAGYCTQLGITLTRDGGVVIEDNGRGVPVDIHPTKKIPTVRFCMPEENLTTVSIKYPEVCTVSELRLSMPFRRA